MIIPTQITQAGSELSIMRSRKTERRERRHGIRTRGTHTQQDHSTRTGRGGVAPLVVVPFPIITVKLRHTRRRAAPQTPRGRSPPPSSTANIYIVLIVHGALDATAHLVLQMNSTHLAALTNADVLNARRYHTLITCIRTGEEERCREKSEQLQ